MTDRPQLDEHFDAQPVHDGTPMTYKGAGFSWDGEYQLSTYRFACDCGFTCEIHTRDLDGGPEAVRRRDGST